MPALLRVKVRPFQRISLGSATLSFVRDLNNILDSSINFSNASGTAGQTFTAGQPLFTTGTSGTVGFMQIRSKNAVSLNGTGIFLIEVEHYPSPTAVNYTQNFSIDGTATSLIANYNSKPENGDVIVETDYNVPYVFTDTDFTAQYTDYDLDALAYVRINGSVTGITYDGNPYVAGTWIPISHIASGRLEYVPTGQTDGYDHDCTYDVQDSQGNISN